MNQFRLPVLRYVTVLQCGIVLALLHYHTFTTSRWSEIKHTPLRPLSFASWSGSCSVHYGINDPSPTRRFKISSHIWLVSEAAHWVITITMTSGHPENQNLVSPIPPGPNAHDLKAAGESKLKSQPDHHSGSDACIRSIRVISSDELRSFVKGSVASRDVPWHSQQASPY